MATVTIAVEAWDKSWSTVAGGADRLDPDPDVMAPLPGLRHAALDLGCALGRHSLSLVKRGLAVEAVDGGAAGLVVMREIARARGVLLGLRQGTADAPASSCSPSNSSSTANRVTGTSTSLQSASRRRQCDENWPVLPDPSPQTLDSSQ